MPFFPLGDIQKNVVYTWRGRGEFISIKGLPSKSFRLCVFFCGIHHKPIEVWFSFLWAYHTRKKERKTGREREREQEIRNTYVSTRLFIPPSPKTCFLLAPPRQTKPKKNNNNTAAKMKITKKKTNYKNQICLFAVWRNLSTTHYLPPLTINTHNK